MSIDSQRRGKAFRQLTAGRHILMGLLLIILAYPMVTFRKFGTIDIGQTTAYVIAGFLVAYGAFRIWRGFVTFSSSDED